MHKITTHLWFDKEAKEAAKFYLETFKQGKIKSTNVLTDTPSGTVDIVTMAIYDHEFTLLSAGPLFKFNPSISFLIACDTIEEVEDLWNKLIQEGTALMELAEYPFSKKYGWVSDKYGLSWQIMHKGEMAMKAKVTPTLMFVGDVYGKTEEAINFYMSVFHDSKLDHMMRYEKGEEPDKEGTIKHAGFSLEGQEFAAMDSAYPHEFKFNEAISLMVHCKDQQEIDYYWEKLSAVPEAEQCGWLKDKFGVSWQIVPDEMDEMMSKGTPEQIARITQAFLQMKKFDLAKLREAAEGK